MKMNHVVAAFSTLAALMATPVSHAAPVTIDAGWDLVQTTTAFFDTPAGLIPFKGVPFGNVNISSLNGVLPPAPSGAKSYGSTDTIIYRSGGTLPDAGVLTVNLQMTALNLVSNGAFDPDGPGSLPYAVYYATNWGQTITEVPGDPSTKSSMDITYNGTDGGTFKSILTFGIALSLINPYDPANNPTFSASDVLYTTTKTFTAKGNWSTTPCPSCLVIPGVNQDSFYMVGQTFHDAGNGTSHTVQPTVPIPAAIFFVAPALFGVFGWSRRRNSST
ncbi:MAG: hypothetical protein NTX45_21685 [Proteobacteria bacterium]|nr:hypothetical protein [Pseudomonadota bacterium]